MPQATVTDLRRYLGNSVEDISDTDLGFILADSSVTVAGQGVPVSHSRHGELSVCYAAYLLSHTGRIQDVASESVESVSTSYARSGTSPSGSPYLDIYRQKRQDVLGFRGRLA
jgi:hypothetical protein